MLDRDRFVEVINDESKEGVMIFPGEIKVRKTIPSEEELKELEIDMDRYSFRVRHNYIYTNWEHSYSDEEYHHKYDEDLATLSDHLKPLYILKDRKFFGVCLTLTFNGKERLGVFLIDGTYYGANTNGRKESYGHVDLEDINEYSLGFK